MTVWNALHRPVFDFGYVGPGLQLQPDKTVWWIDAGKPAMLRYAVAAWDGKVGKDEVAAVYNKWLELTGGKPASGPATAPTK